MPVGIHFEGWVPVGIHLEGCVWGEVGMGGASLGMDIGGDVWLPGRGGKAFPSTLQTGGSGVFH